MPLSPRLNRMFISSLPVYVGGHMKHKSQAFHLSLEDAEESDRRDLLSELSIMKKLPHHRHVVTLLGCVTTSGTYNSSVLILYSQRNSQARSLQNNLVFLPRELHVQRALRFFWKVFGRQGFQPRRTPSKPLFS